MYQITATKWSQMKEPDVMLMDTGGSFTTTKTVVGSTLTGSVSAQPTDSCLKGRAKRCVVVSRITQRAIIFTKRFYPHMMKNDMLIKETSRTIYAIVIYVNRCTRLKYQIRSYLNCQIIYWSNSHLPY